MKDNNTKIYAGFSRICITPDFPAKLGGYADNRVHKTVTDDLTASCVAISDGSNTALVFSVEILSILAEYTDTIRAAVEAATGIPVKNIFINATHCHSAPLACQVVELLSDKLSVVAREALADLAECEIYAGTKDVEGLVYIRRYLCEDGTFWTPKNPSPVFAHETKVDATMPLIKFAREGKRDIILSNFASHSDTVAVRDYNTISADYVGVARRAIEDKGEYFLAMQMGAAGDVVPCSRLKGEYSYKELNTYQYGGFVAKAIEDGILELQKVDTAGGVRVASENYHAEVNHTQDHLLPYTEAIWIAAIKGEKEKVEELLAKIPEVKGGVEECGGINLRECRPPFYELEMSTLAVGDVALTFCPYEMFSNTGREIKKASPFSTTFVCSLTNGEAGYIPARRSFENGGYETHCTSFFAGTAEATADVLVKQLNELH